MHRNSTLMAGYIQGCHEEFFIVTAMCILNVELQCRQKFDKTEICDINFQMLLSGFNARLCFRL